MGTQALVSFENSPFPYDGRIPETGDPGTPFLVAEPDGRRFHLSPRGGKLYEATYGDRRTLLSIPSHFNPSRPAAIILFLHGNLATLQRDVVDRQHVPQQVEASGLNAVLVAPQLAVDALDSSAGRFWTPGFLDSYLDEAARRLEAMSKGRVAAQRVRDLPVIVVAYSGGYLATAFSLAYEMRVERPRIKGVILLDALFGEEQKFAAWVGETRRSAFFVSAYSDASKGLNAQLAGTLADQGIAVAGTLPASIGPGTIVLQPVRGAVHNDFVTQAWTKAPLRDVLWRVDLGVSPLP